MAIAGSLIYDTEIDKSGFKKGLSSLTNSVKSGGTKIKNIVSALGITKLISTAFNTINNSIDGAVSRLDTMNNFPKVMSNLGIGVEESKEAINDLSERLKGIPTTLDAAALSVERFTSKNGDVKKSVEIFTAVNNALLAGGASSEIQASALEQLSQAYAKGKPDMVEWRSIQTAMPAQLKQVAQAMGMTTDELGEGLRKGGVEMDDFIETMIRLNKEGTGQFQSFEKQAKNATGGIKTSITNAKTAIVRGVGNIVTAIDTVLKKTELKGLSNVISKIGSTSENVLKKVAEGVSKINLNKILNTVKQLSNVYVPKIKSIFSIIVNVLKNMWTWATKNKGVIVSVVGVVFSLIASMKAYKGVMSAIQGINIAKNIISALSPTTALISLTLGLGIAAATVATAMAKQKTSLDGVKDAAELQQKSWKSLKEAREQSLSKSESEIVTIQRLADELRKMTDENGKVKEGYENRAKYILGELNNALGTEYQMNGNIISQYGELKDNIDQLISKKKAEATLDAYKEEYQTSLKNQAEATKTLTDLRQKYNDELNKTTNGYQEEQEKMRNLNYIGSQIKNQSELIGEYGYTVEKYEKLTSASVSNSKDEIEKALSEMGVSYDQAKAKTNNSLTEQIQSQSNYVSLLKQSWQEAKDNNDTFQAKILQKQLDTEQQSLINLANSLAQQTSTVSNLTEEQKIAWKNLAETSYSAYEQGLSQVPEETRKKIEEATGVILLDTGLENASSKEAGSATTLFSQNLKISEKTKENIEQASKNLYSDTMVENGAKVLADDANSGFNNNVDGNKWGTDLSSNISSGMTSQRSQSGIMGAATSIAGWIKSIIGHSVPKTGPLKDELTYMPDMIDNLVKGIDKNRYKISKATNQMAKDIKDGFDLEGLNNDIMREMNKAVAFETGSINANASVKSNNSMLNVIRASFNIDGSVDIDGKKAGRILAPSVVKTIKTGGLA
jgi:tape measure domain-containing protein|nr:MAG TPA: tail tape measure protein [Caudoviricetes sp.]